MTPLSTLFYLSISLITFFSCNKNKELARTNIVKLPSEDCKDTIIIIDSIPFLQTVFVKELNNENVILPIDTILQKCMTEKANSTTTGMIDCYEESSALLLKKIDKIDGDLTLFLDKKHSVLLKKSQAAWKQFFKDEKEFLYNTYYTGSDFSNYPSLGREASIDQAAWKYEVIKQRLIAMELYYNRVYYKKNK